MSILNYFFIGVGFTFIIDLLLNVEDIKNHPIVIDKPFSWGMRIMCVLLWPFAILVFLIAFVKQFFRK